MKKELLIKKPQKQHLSTQLKWALAQVLPDNLSVLSVAKCLQKRFVENCYQRAGLAAVLEFIMSSPELKPHRITDGEDKN